MYFCLMKVYQLYATQFLAVTPRTAWEFLSDPENLQRITPGHMGFRILAGTGMPMYPGQIIHYRVSPFRGLTTSWVTEITHVEPERYFVDEQRFGPYSFWHHKHFIRPVEGGVSMEDIIDYKLPFGIIGQWLHGMLVKPQLKQIFEYRSLKLQEMYGHSTGNKASIIFKTV